MQSTIQRARLTSITNGAGTLTYWTANTVSATGKILTETLGNGATTTYDVLERMTGNVVAKSGTNLQNFTYTYDTISNLKQRVDVVQSSLTENFAYDRLNRLLQSSGSGLTTKSTAITHLGNITSKSRQTPRNGMMFASGPVGGHQRQEANL